MRLRDNPLYNRWNCIRRRCGVINSATADERRIYQGMTMEKVWEHDFPAFEEWMLSHGWHKGLCIGRSDHSKGWLMDNIVIEPFYETMNRNRNLLRNENGETLRDIARKHHQTLSQRRHQLIAVNCKKYGLPVEAAAEFELNQKRSAQPSTEGRTKGEFPDGHLC